MTQSDEQVNEQAVAGSPANGGTDLRYEMKLVCEPRWLAQARTWIRLHPEGFWVAYPPRQVNNVYLDTPDLNSFNANVTGVSTRQKLRLRWYGPLDDDLIVTQPILELKYKTNMVGGKRRQLLDCTLDLKRPWADILRTIHTQADPEWHHWLRMATQPTLVNHYQREYYVTPDGIIRATLDYGQAAYDQRLGTRPNLKNQLLLPDVVVIEVKSTPEESERLQALMAYFPLPRSRNSKYVKGVMAALL